MNDAFVFDTYALIEIIRGNKNYIPYLKATPIINEFIFAELCFNLIREYGIARSSNILNKYIDAIVVPNPKLIQNAMVYRLQHKKSNISMTHCIGYLQAQELRIPFLTGDKEFKDLPYVEFVK